MDNLKYYNDSLAYDFEMFSPKPAIKEKSGSNIIVMPKNGTKKRSAAATRSLSAPAALIMLAVFILAGLCGNIAIRLRINEVNSQINDVKAQLSELDSEKTSLEVEMQRRISFANLELEATQLGMVKPDKDDITYIRVNSKNAAKTADGVVTEEE